MTWFLFFFLLLFPWALARLESSKDARRADLWNHFMKENFHMKWGFLRGWLLALASFLAYQPDLLLAAACFAYQFCAFGFGFTFWLNTSRNKDAFYQSREPKAARTDRAFVALAKFIGVWPEQVAGWVYTTLLALSTLLYIQYSI